MRLRAVQCQKGGFCRHLYTIPAFLSKNVSLSGRGSAPRELPLLRRGAVHRQWHNCVAARGLRDGVRGSWAPWGWPVQLNCIASAHAGPRDRADKLPNVLRSPRDQGNLESFLLAAINDFVRANRTASCYLRGGTFPEVIHLVWFVGILSCWVVVANKHFDRLMSWGLTRCFGTRASI